MSDYDARNRSSRTLEDARALLGERVSLTLTGTIVDAGESDGGTYVKFELDERWGFRHPQRFVMDSDPFEVIA